jgi:chemotaxis protein CheD
VLSIATSPPAVAGLVNVPVAGYGLARQTGVLTSAGLGSCVAIILHDASFRTGAMAHVLLPNESMSRDRTRPTKFASTAVEFLLGELRAVGAAGRPSVRLVGGASMFGSLLRAGGVNMGERNVDAARSAVRAAGLRVLDEEVGGEHGRTVYFDVADGTVRVVSMHGGERVF